MSNLLDSLVETLKTAEPRPQAIESTIVALDRPHPPRLVPLAVGVTTLTIVALWPRPGNGLAWAQIAAQDLPLRYHETVTEIVDGTRRLDSETWIDRGLKAYRSGNVNLTSTTGSFLIISPKGIYQWINGLATFSQPRRSERSFDLRSEEEFRERIDVYKALRESGIRQTGVDRHVETRLGTADRYRLEKTSTDRGSRRSIVVFVRPETARILGYDVHDRDRLWQATFEYPDRFPPDTFAIPPKGAVKPYDLDAINAWVSKRLRTPLAILKAGGRTATLRLVAQGARNELYVLWSGTKPNGDLAHRVRVLSVKNQEAYGLAAFTTKGGQPRTPFGGHAVQLVQHVDRVDLRIPVFAPNGERSRFVGYAIARNVPVGRIYDIRSIFPALGTSPQ